MNLFRSLSSPVPNCLTPEMIFNQVSGLGLQIFEALADAREFSCHVLTWQPLCEWQIVMYRVGFRARVKRVAWLLWLGRGLAVFAPLFVSAQGSVELSWDPSTDTNAVGYNIYYGVSSAGYTSKISAGSATSLEISGLKEGQTYYFAATAYDSSGNESEFSNQTSYSVPSTVLPLAGLQSSTYNGLFYETNAVQVQSAGAFNLSVTAAGKYSGILQMSAGRLPFSGQFGALCQATNQIPRKHTNALVLNFSLNSSNEVLGSVSDGLWVASLYGERNGPYGTNWTPAPGKYTLMIRGIRTASNSLGDGFGILTLSSKGAVHFSGALADGTKLSQSASVSEYGNWPLYAPLYSGQGLAIGWMAFTNSGDPDLQGLFNWIKPPNPKSLLYQGGLAVQRPVMGSSYIPGSNPVTNIETAELLLGGALAGSSNEVLSLKFSQANGTFTGQIRNDADGEPMSFQGALLQQQGTGYGFVLGTNLSSPVTLIP